MELAARRGRLWVFFFHRRAHRANWSVFEFFFFLNVSFSPTAFRRSAKNKVRHEREIALKLPVIPLWKKKLVQNGLPLLVRSFSDFFG